MALYMVFENISDKDTASDQISVAGHLGMPGNFTLYWNDAQQRISDNKWVMQVPPVEWLSAVTVPYSIEEEEPGWWSI